jgi:hypothetical protein
MLYSLGARLADMGSAVVFRRFVKRYGLYMDAVCHEAKDRENSFLRDSESYMSMRRDTIGTKPCFDLILLSSTLGDKELNDPVILELEKLATDMIIWTNVSPLQTHRLLLSRVG